MINKRKIAAKVTVIAYMCRPPWVSGGKDLVKCPLIHSIKFS
jgi:hypothetical protein